MRKASVIVPVYGAEQYLAQCLDSLLEQDYPEYDIILVDDCSRDRSFEIAREYATRYPDKIKLLRNEENIGQGRSRMRAVYVSDADYILFVDSDDYVAGDYISTFMKANDGDYDLIIAGYTRDTNGRMSKVCFPDSEYTIMLYSNACCKMIRRTFLTENGIDFTDARRGEDIYFACACYASRPKAKMIPYCGYYYRLNRNSTTKSMSWETGFEETVIRMFAEFRKHYGDRITTPEQKEKTDYVYVANIVNALVVYAHGCGLKRMKEKRQTVETDIHAHYSEIMKNKQLRFTRPVGVRLKIRMGVGAFYWSRKLHLDGLLFGLIALI